jgi:hypothetical protein
MFTHFLRGEITRPELSEEIVSRLFWVIHRLHRHHAVAADFPALRCGTRPSFGNEIILFSTPEGLSGVRQGLAALVRHGLLSLGSDQPVPADVGGYVFLKRDQSRWTGAKERRLARRNDCPPPDSGNDSRDAPYVNVRQGNGGPLLRVVSARRLRTPEPVPAQGGNSYGLGYCVPDIEVAA